MKTPVSSLFSTLAGGGAGLVTGAPWKAVFALAALALALPYAGPLVRDLVNARNEARREASRTRHQDRFLSEVTAQEGLAYLKETQPGGPPDPQPEPPPPDAAEP
ncbi:hypothetical protein OOK36_46170 [Streptomyces sp. NBC_00365]|uniref:hypothetical protein n=1 Tax=Streptomyces sp. NBC_00365 TaxID=2975726 RepID=UPI00225043D5|nr:hypothetical protein [Streptomyces sp. NBC_00365]MCX5096053.1 hypothetical protein [Streptomyces sp. NBC_00365]